MYSEHGDESGKKTHWREKLYDFYVSSGQGGKDALNGFVVGKPYFKNIISKYFPEDRKSTIRDFGCGAGGLIYWLKSSGYKNVSGVDSSHEMVTLAHNVGISEVVHGDLYEALLAEREGSVDVCVLLDVLEHLSREEIFAVFDEILRALRPGGRVILHVPNAGGIFGSTIRYSDLTHETAFTSVSVQQLLNVAGFVQISCYEDRPIPHGFKSFARLFIWHLASSLFRLVYAAETGSFNCILSQNLLAVALKPEK